MIVQQSEEYAHWFSGMINPEAVLDEIPLGVAILDVSGRVVFVNQTYEIMTGVDRHAVIGIGCLHALRCSYCVLSCPFFKGEKDFSPLIADSDLLNRNRQKMPIKLKLSPLRDQSGKVLGFLETIQESGKGTFMADTFEKAYSIEGMVGHSEQMAKVFRMLPSIAQTDSSVLITGETGTGKDLLAESLHKSSDRSDGPFIKVNCGALPDTLLESELFGHTKGAFTGADKSKPGRFRMAHGGSLFLTEIGDFPLQLQVKLLSVLDDRVIYPLGSSQGYEVDVRIIVATHRNLDEMVSQKTFRKDLLFRLNVIRLHVPPLRERGNDIVLLLEHFRQAFCLRFAKKIKSFSDDAMQVLKTYPYPGNVRELRNIVEYAVNFCDLDQIRPSHLPSYLCTPGSNILPHAQESNLSGSAVFRPVPAAVISSSVQDSSQEWAVMEKQMILQAMRESRGRKGDAARLLGWGRSTLWRKMKAHGIA